MRSLLRSVVVLTLLSPALAMTAQAQQAMDNAAVLKLQAAGLGDDLIVNTVTNSPGHYSMTTDDMIALKKAGISDKVMGAMMQKNAGVSAAPIMAAGAPGPAIAGVDEVGCYYKKDGNWTAFAPEIINYKSGGVLKSIASQGIVKGDKNGHIPGKTAKITLLRQTQLLIYVPEGTSPEEYQLIKLRQNSDNREFRSETGGVFHNSTGAQRDAKTFTSVKVAPRMYQITLAAELPVGEYGILPPGSLTSSNAASAGKMYTFSLPE